MNTTISQLTRLSTSAQMNHTSMMMFQPHLFLASFPKFNYIQAMGEEWTDTVFSRLAHIVNLHLLVSHTARYPYTGHVTVTDIALSHLACIKQLWLYINQSVQLTDVAFQSTHFTQLTDLDLSRPQNCSSSSFTDAVFAPLMSLIKLGVHGFDFAPQAIVYVAGMLCRHNAYMMYMFVYHMYLYIWCIFVYRYVTLKVSNCPQLTTLPPCPILLELEVDNIDNTALTNQHSLQILCLYQQPVHSHKASYHTLQSSTRQHLTSLVSLYVNKCGLIDDSTFTLLTNLQKLHMHHSSPTLITGAMFATLHRLENVLLHSCNNITDASLVYMQHVTHFNVNGAHQVTDNALRNLHSIQDLNVAMSRYPHLTSALTDAAFLMCLPLTFLHTLDIVIVYNSQTLHSLHSHISAV